MKKIRINFEKFSDGILIPQFPWRNGTLQVTAVFARFLHSISYICCQHGIFDTRLALSYVGPRWGGGGGGGGG